MRLDGSDKSQDWLLWKDAFKKENELRLSTVHNNLCTYGIKPLDDALMGIQKNELIVIGADSGAGKSDLALNIAQHNAKNNKTVAVFYLEGGYQEAIARMKYRDICEHYLKTKAKGEYVELDYRKWMLNMEQNEKIHEIEGEIYASYDQLYKDNLYFYQSPSGLNVDRLTASLIDFCKLEFDDDGQLDRKYYLDLLVIDHLQYFSLDKDENEIQEITKILRTVKNITDEYNIPVILVSHLRKKGKDRGLPGQEDFYGSSNIVKIATTAITIAPDYYNDDVKNGVYPTYFRVVKNRLGMRQNLAVKINFFLESRGYTDTYEIYRLDNHGNVANEPLADNEKPKWARRF